MAASFFRPLAKTASAAFLAVALLFAVTLSAAVREFKGQAASTPVLTDGYGTVMASSGDWLAVAAPLPASGLRLDHTGGRVVLWKKDEFGNWQMQQTLLCPGLGGLDPENRFGGKMAMNGPNLLISSYHTTSQHKVHVYRQDAGGQWLEDAVLLPQTPAGTNAAFGTSLAIIGDRVAIGSPAADGERGRVDTYERLNGVWEHVQALLHDSPQAGERHGETLNFHRSAMGTLLIVGSPSFDGGSPLRNNAGRVTVYGFLEIERQWTKSRDFMAPDPVAESRFGSQVRVEGDVLQILLANKLLEYAIPQSFPLLRQINLGNDYNKILHGSLCVDAFYTESLYVTRRQADHTFRSELYRTASVLGLASRPLNESFVMHAISENEILIGGLLRVSSTRTVSSTVICLRKVGSTWTRVVSPVPWNVLRVREGAFGTIGSSIAAAGPWTAVSSTQHPNSPELLMNSQVYTYQRQADGSQKFHSLLPDPTGVSDFDQSFLGLQVAAATHPQGDFIAVGAARKATSGPGSGNGYWDSEAVVIYQHDKAADAWVQRALITPPAGVDAAGFGYSLSLHSNRLAIGVPGDGKVCLYELDSTGSPTLQAVLTAANPVDHEDFGQSVSLEGDWLAVGAPSRLPGQSGAAYVYRRSEGAWAQWGRLPAPDMADAAVTPGFGTCVSLASSRLIIGAGAGAPYQAASYQRSFFPGSLPDVFAHETTFASTGTTGAITCAATGDATVVLSDGAQTSLWSLQGTTWENRTSYLDRAYPKVQALAVSAGQLFLPVPSPAATPPTPEKDSIRVIDLALPPIVEVHDPFPGTEPECLLTSPGLLLMREFRITNPGLLPLTARLSLTGDTTDFELGKTELVIQPDMATGSTFLNFKPKSLGLKSITVTITTDAPGQTPFVVTLTARAVAQTTALSLSTQPVSCFLGTHLQVGVQGTQPFNYRWLKDGKTLPGTATPQILPTAAGRYQVEITNPHGSIRSREVRVAEVLFTPFPGIQILTGEKAVWTVKTRGTGPVIEWRNLPAEEPGSQVFKTSPGIKISTASGSSTLTLSMADPPPVLYARVRMPVEDGGEISREQRLTVSVHNPPRVDFPWAPEGVLTLNQPQDAALRLTWDGPILSTPIFKCTGLPSGMTLNTATGRITGTPTKIGYYNLAASVIIDRYKGTVTTRKVVVIPADLPTPGVYEGLIAGSSALPLGGHVSLTLQPTGSFSASVRVGPKTARATGSLNPVPGATSGARRTTTAFKLPHTLSSAVQNCVFVSGNGFFDLVPEGAVSPSPAPLADLQITHVPSQDSHPGPHLGKHGVGLVFGDARYGSGFGTVTVSKDSLLTYAILSPDGVSLTGSGYAPPGGQLSALCYLRDSTGSAVHGRIGIPTTSAHRRSMTWTRLPKKGRLNPDGLTETDLDFITSRIDTATVRSVFAGKWYNLQLGTEGGGIFTSQGIMWSTTPASNTAFTLLHSYYPVKIKLSIAPSTALMSGQFTLDETHPITGKPAPRTIPFKGIFLPDLARAVGHHLLPDRPDPYAEPPTTSSTTRLRSGSVNLVIP